jgi:uncharacterized RDD family membrane protein YckC
LNSAIDTIISAETPEGIEISIRPAGFAVRCTAFLIDAIVRIAILLACGTALSAAGHFGDGMLFIVLFLINWLYPVAFELTPAAATPGKRLTGLYVLMANGLPITPAGCLTRNLLRVIDVLPMMYAFAIVSILLRHDARRLGDLAGGTIVAYRNEMPKRGAFALGTAMPPRVRLSSRQQRAVTAFAWRAARLTPQRAEEIAGYAATAISHPGPRSPDGVVPSATPMTAYLIGIARWLHGERPSNAPGTEPPV